MSKRKDREYLFDIKEAIDRIKNYTKDIDFGTFIAKTEKQDAVLRNLEIIGEAVKNISPEIKNKYSVVNWKSIAGLRDKVIHFYFGVNLEIVWDVVQNKLGNLERTLDKILEDLGETHKS
ncbi:HepT-like ribonuclease domain-containing protein [Caldisericum exile]|uniref:DUF86 domain-containing protein n=1 Tax=Caldisericum exile (strain DSM 21853 / NBRC 104410 / AZM16c01) TaxID=511051 RepID=A0A7U6JFL1_CALEA|nr:DUF86 domain-containing protein [Caldisericum exile]BAL81633.1 hypothetical protein CSE_15070 [Caldisericum exile AZM16c01]